MFRRSHPTSTTHRPSSLPAFRCPAPLLFAHSYKVCEI